MTMTLPGHRSDLKLNNNHGNTNMGSSVAQRHTKYCTLEHQPLCKVHWVHFTLHWHGWTHTSAFYMEAAWLHFTRSCMNEFCIPLVQVHSCGTHVSVFDLALPRGHPRRNQHKHILRGTTLSAFYVPPTWVHFMRIQHERNSHSTSMVAYLWHWNWSECTSHGTGMSAYTWHQLEGMHIDGTLHECIVWATGTRLFMWCTHRCIHIAPTRMHFT